MTTKATVSADPDAADLERLADLAEAGFDPATFRPRPGRRPIGDLRPGEHSPRMATRVSPSVRSAFIARARAEGKTPSQALRDLMEAYARGSAPTGSPAAREGS